MAACWTSQKTQRVISKKRRIVEGANYHCNSTSLRFLTMPAFVSNAELIKEIKELREAVSNRIEEPLTLERASVLLGIPEKRLREMANRMEIPNYKKGASFYFFPSEVNQWIKSGRNIYTFIKQRSA